MSWQASHSKAIAHTLHVAAIAGLTAPGYARRDAKLRRAAGRTGLELDGKALVLGPALEASARTDVSPWQAHDADWFEVRWEMGEDQAIRAQTEALVASLEALGLDGLIPPGTRVQASSAVGARPLGLAEPAMVLAGPETATRVVAVALLGATVNAGLPDNGLRAADQAWVAEIIACSAIRHVVGEEAFTDWLPDLMRHIVGEFTGGQALEARVRRIAEASLDQPPGEIVRIGVGLGRRLKSRLDRAIRRGFFVPPNFDFEGWLTSTLNGQGGPRTD